MKTDIGSFFAVMHAKHHFTRNCFASSYINDWHQMMDYKVDRPYVFTGVYSYHSKKSRVSTFLNYYKYVIYIFVLL